MNADALKLKTLIGLLTDHTPGDDEDADAQMLILVRAILAAKMLGE